MHGGYLMLDPSATFSLVKWVFAVKQALARRSNSMILGSSMCQRVCVLFYASLRLLTTVVSTQVCL